MRHHGRREGRRLAGKRLPGAGRVGACHAKNPDEKAVHGGEPVLLREQENRPAAHGRQACGQLGGLGVCAAHDAGPVLPAGGQPGRTVAAPWPDLGILCLYGNNSSSLLNNY